MVLLTGCRGEPFQQPPLPTLRNPNPQLIRENFPKLLPDEFTTDDTLILQFPFHDDLVMLGVLNVNKPAGTFELYAVNQMGVPFFHLSGNRSGVAVRDAIGPWLDHKDILLAIARGIQHIYFNPAPDSTATVAVSFTHVDFKQKTAEGTISYQFGMEPTVLLQKQLDGIFGPVWRARYYDYRPGTGGKLFPAGIVLDDNPFHYRLIIKNRDWSIDEKE
jgi:hypothetical protein